jgi:hypothetical protein
MSLKKIPNSYSNRIMAALELPSSANEICGCVEGRGSVLVCACAARGVVEVVSADSNQIFILCQHGNLLEPV